MRPDALSSTQLAQCYTLADNPADTANCSATTSSACNMAFARRQPCLLETQTPARSQGQSSKIWRWSNDPARQHLPLANTRIHRRQLGHLPGQDGLEAPRRRLHELHLPQQRLCVQAVSLKSILFMSARAVYAATKFTVGRCRWWGLHKF